MSKKKKKLSFRVAHSLAASGIVFGAMACDSKPPNVNTTPPEQPPTVNTVDPSIEAEPAAPAADAGASDAAAAVEKEPAPNVEPKPEPKPNVNTPRPTSKP